jgi:hypothetical protein
MTYGLRNMERFLNLYIDILRKRTGSGETFIIQDTAVVVVQKAIVIVFDETRMMRCCILCY